MKKFNTPPSVPALCALLFLIALMLAGGGCSTMRFAYNHGDTLLYWWINAYLDLDSDQSGWVKKDIDNLFSWHRKTQLKDYAQLLTNGQRQLRRQCDRGRPDGRLPRHQEPHRAAGLQGAAGAGRPGAARSSRSRSRRWRRSSPRTTTTFRKNSCAATDKTSRSALQEIDGAVRAVVRRFQREQEAVLRRPPTRGRWTTRSGSTNACAARRSILALLRKVQQEKLSKDATMALMHNLIKEIFDRFEAPERKAFFDAYTDRPRSS
jgi:hypothetical protein